VTHLHPERAALQESVVPQRIALLAAQGVAGFATMSRVRLFASILAAEGREVVCGRDGDPLAPDWLVWLDGNPLWFPKTRAMLRKLPPSQRPPIVTWHTEPLPLPSGADFPSPRRTVRERVTKLLRRPSTTTSDPAANGQLLIDLHRAGVAITLAVSSLSSQEFLAEHGIASTHVPFGGSPWVGSDLGLERDIDVVFVGDLRVARRRRLIEALRSAGVDIVARGGWGADGLWGEKRTELLNRAKINLNLARYEGYLSGTRLVLGMANGCLVVSEPIYKPDPWVPGEHFVSATLEDMPETIARLLADDAERERIATAGRRLVTEELTLERALERVAGAADARSAGG
jgi:hypothetical protein